MKRSPRCTKYFFILILTISSHSIAHHTGDHAVVLHTNNKWDDCAMVLDPSLTQNQWHTFAKDISSIIYFKPTLGAKPLGRGHYDISIETSYTEPLQDGHGSWNNTFSHPSADHWLVGDSHRLNIPLIAIHVGINDNIDMGLIYTENYAANYGWTGMDIKYNFYRDPGKRLFLATKLSAVTLLGVDDFDYYQAAADVLASKDFKWFTPYAGIAALYSFADEPTPKVNLKDENVVMAIAVVGTQARWKFLKIGAEADFAKISIFTIKIGASF